MAKGSKRLWAALALICVCVGVTAGCILASNAEETTPVQDLTGFVPLALAADQWSEVPSSPLQAGASASGGQFAISIHQSDHVQFDTHNPTNSGHGANCEAPPATHVVTAWANNTFVCNAHIMTGMQIGGYGVTAITKNQLLDWTSGPATFSWDMDTRKINSRDWFDVTVVPFEDLAQFWDTRGEATTPLPRHGIELRDFSNIHLQLFNGTGAATGIATSPQYWYDGVNLPLDGPAPNQASARQPFQITISRTHVKFERLATATGSYQLFIDSDIPAQPFTKGMVSWGEHNYDSIQGGDLRLGTPGGTSSGVGPAWHLDEFAMTCNGGQSCNTVTLIKAQQEKVIGYGPAQGVVHFNAAAPAGSFLAFTSQANVTRISWDNGATWITPVSNIVPVTDIGSFFVPVPLGATSVLVDVVSYTGYVVARDFHVWSLGTTPTEPTPVPVTATAVPATPTKTATATATRTPTKTPTPAPGTTNTPIAPTATAVPGATGTPSPFPTPPCRPQQSRQCRTPAR